MKLRICCDANVDLPNIICCGNVEAVIKEYELKDISLNGIVNISGNFQKDLESYEPFSEQVPFTVMFKNTNYEIINIAIEDFTSYVVSNQGLECRFEIAIEYDFHEEIKEDLEPIPAIAKEELPKEEVPKEEIKEPISDLDKKVEDEINNEILIDEIDVKEENETISDIKTKYDNLLDDIFNQRDNDKGVEIKIKKNSEKVSLNSIPDSKGTFRVYYPKHENELEKISKDENISITSIYANDLNKDFMKNRRVIIKK